MEEIFDKLMELQDILTEKIGLEKRIQEMPETLATQEEILAKLKADFVEISQKCENSKRIEEECRRNLSEAEASREQSEKKMELIETQREYEALDKEIQTASEAEQEFRKNLSSELKILSDLDGKLKENQALIEDQESELAETRRDMDAEISEKQGRIEILLEREQEVSKGMDPDVLFKFERIIRNKMGLGIVAIKGGICTGCHMILPAQFANSVRQGEEIVFCPYCSRVLFYAEAEDGEEDYFYDEDPGSLSDLDDADDEDFADEDDEEDEAVNIDYNEE